MRQKKGSQPLTPSRELTVLAGFLAGWQRVACAPSEDSDALRGYQLPCTVERTACTHQCSGQNSQPFAQIASGLQGGAL